MKNQDLIIAILDRYLEGVEEYIREGGNVNEFLHEGMSPLVFALSSYVHGLPSTHSEKDKFDKIILRLLDARSNVNATHPLDGTTATMMVMRCRRSDEIVMKFINVGTNVSFRCKSGKTVLIYAIENCYGETVVRELLNKGADADYPSEGLTPLYYAVSDNNDPDVIELLLRAGANIHAGDENGKPLIAFCCQDICKLDGICRYKRVTDILIKKGAVLRGTFCYGDTILHLTFCNYVIWLALRDGVSIETRNNRHMTPLIYSIYHNEANKVNDLLLLGANPNCENSIGCTPLHNFNAILNERFVNLLLFHGANLLAKNYYQDAPIDMVYSIFICDEMIPGIKVFVKHYLLYIDETGIYEYIRRIATGTRRGYFLRFIDRCKAELCTMRNMFLKEDFTFYDFCYWKKFYRTKFIRIEIDEYKCDHGQISAYFPIFKHVILMRFQDNARKKFKQDLMKNLVKLTVRAPVNVEFEYSSELAYDYLHRASKYLTFKQIYVLFLASFNS